MPSRVPYLVGVLLLLIVMSAPHSTSAAKKARETSKTHYDVLQISQDATLTDVKKAYRKLAVQTHPDRNLDNVEEATIRFREVSEAYEILSDEKARKDYDRILKYGGGESSSGGYRSGNTGGGGGVKFNWSSPPGGAGGGSRRTRSEFKHRDPFAQFNDVFQNDPFFASAFKSMDDLFDKTFASEASKTTNKDVQNSGGVGFWSFLTNWLPDIKVETKTTTTINGKTSHSQSSRNIGGGRRQRRTTSGGYTSRSTRTTVENGRRVTVQSLEKDGNKIEERYVGDVLIERKINGAKQNIDRIGDGEF